MIDIFAPHLPEYSIHLPQDPILWIVLGVWFLLFLVSLILFQDQKISFNRRNLIWFAILSALVLVLTSFCGLELFPGVDLQGTNLPVNYFMFLLLFHGWLLLACWERFPLA